MLSYCSINIRVFVLINYIDLIGKKHEHALEPHSKVQRSIVQVGVLFFYMR